MAPYAAAEWNAPVVSGRTAGRSWNRKFRCRRCHTVAGYQVVRPRVDTASRELLGYVVERVELPYFIRRLDDLADGTPSLGYSAGLRKKSPSASGSVVAHYTPAHESVGDPYRVTRRGSTRSRDASGFWTLALEGEAASRPFVTTCANRACRRRIRVDSPPTAEIMARAQDRRARSAVLG